MPSAPIISLVSTPGASFAATSTTSVALGTGTKTFTTQAGLAYSANMRVRVAYNASNYLEGPITSYSSTTLVVAADRFVGTGTYTAWTINAAGDQGAAGASFVTSETGASNALVATLAGVVPANGVCIILQLSHSLQAGANTLNLNTYGVVSIKSSRNPSNNIATAYAATGRILLCYTSSGPAWLDMSQ
jgi:hypothetical protein